MTCPCCNLDVLDDVRHFLIECPAHVCARDKLFVSLRKYIKGSSSLSDDDWINIILDLRIDLLTSKLHEQDFILAISSFLKTIYNVRSLLLKCG